MRLQAEIEAKKRAAEGKVRRLLPLFAVSPADLPYRSRPRPAQLDPESAARLAEEKTIRDKITRLLMPVCSPA